ncbi:MAG: type VI secretion system tube protein Hcp [Ignavibacteriota bacterium]
MTQSSRFMTASIFVLALSVLSTSVSFGALNAYLKLKGQHSGKSYKAVPDASGKFSFKDVAPDTYTLVFVGSPASPAVTVKGESSDDGHKDWIEISSFSFGSSNSGSMTTGSGASGREASAPSVSEIVVTKQMDAVSPRGVTVASGAPNRSTLATQCAKGTHFPPVKLEMRTTGSGDPSTVVYQDIVVASTGTLDGAVKASWNLKENVK